jgi:hypothetical protein
LSSAINGFSIIANAYAYTAIAFIGTFFLAESFRHVSNESEASRLQESRDFLMKFHGLSLRKAGYTQEKVNHNVHRVSVSVAHSQALALFFITFIFLFQRLSSSHYAPDYTVAFAVIAASVLPWIASGK